MTRPGPPDAALSGQRASPGNDEWKPGRPHESWTGEHGPATLPAISALKNDTQTKGTLPTKQFAALLDHSMLDVCSS
jgi:hypothetical protein